MFGEFFRFELRYQLMPYLWTCVQTSCREHVPIIRPTFFNFPDDMQCFEDCDDFMLGQDLLIAPVVEEGARQRSVYLPQLPDGLKWLDFYNKTAYESGRTHVVPAPLQQLPLFAKQGAKIALASPRPGKTAHHDDPVIEVHSF